jgi:hypothetical protein
MRTCFVKTLSVLLALCSSSVLGQDKDQTPGGAISFKPAEGQAFRLDLDTAEGAYSEWQHDDVSSFCALHTSVRIKRLRTDVRWVPTFSIWFADSDKRDQGKHLALQFRATYRTPPLETRIVFWDSPTKTLEHTLKTTVKLDKPVPLEIVWLQHSILMNIGQESVRLPLDWEIRSIAVSASTGEMKLEPLILGCVEK